MFIANTLYKLQQERLKKCKRNESTIKETTGIVLLNLFCLGSLSLLIYGSFLCGWEVGVAFICIFIFIFVLLWTTSDIK